MDTVVTETRVTLDPGFFGQDVIVLAFKISENLLEAKEYYRISTRERQGERATERGKESQIEDTNTIHHPPPQDTM